MQAGSPTFVATSILLRCHYSGSETCLERRAAWRAAIQRRSLWRDANIQQRKTLPLMTSGRVNEWRNLTEVPGVDAGGRRGRARLGGHIVGGEQASWSEQVSIGDCDGHRQFLPCGVEVRAS